MSRVSLLAALFSVMFCQTSLAATVSPIAPDTFRYEFDVVASDFRLGFFDNLPQSDPSYSARLLDSHPIREMIGLTGSHVIEVTNNLGEFNTVDDPINCVSGFICPRGFDLSEATANRFYNGNNTGLEYTLTSAGDGTGELFFFGDGPITGGGVVNGVSYAWFGSYATFSLENVSITEVSAVPLPAGLPLLLACLGGLGLIARRKKRLS